MNLQGLFNQGYEVVQSGTDDYSLTRDGAVIVEFEVLDNDVGQQLLNEINFHIRRIRDEDEDYFSDCTAEEIEYIMTDFLKELILIGDILK